MSSFSELFSVSNNSVALVPMAKQEERHETICAMQQVNVGRVLQRTKQLAALALKEMSEDASLERLIICR